MMANRFQATFADPTSVGCKGSDKLRGNTPGINGWNKSLNAVADVYSLMNEIQRTWAYLESLFIHSEEVKKELPEATKRFEKIDICVKVRCCFLLVLMCQTRCLSSVLMPPGKPLSLSH
jgi:hypothetical protein